MVVDRHGAGNSARSLTRRAIARTALGATSVGLLGASPLRAVAQSASPAATASAGDTRVIETIHGPVTIPAHPTRILPVNFPSAVTLLELGVTPVGITSYLPILAPGIASPEGIPVIESDAGELDLELIASLKPDLIVGSDWKNPADQQAPYQDLSRIAPTALFEWTQAAGNWPAEAAGCADAIGKTAELDALRTAYTDLAATIKSTYSDQIAADTWDLITAGPDAWYLYGPSSSHGQVLAAAGIHLGAAASQVDGYVEYSPERFDILQKTGAILIRTGDKDAVIPQATFTSLPAVMAGRLFTSDYFFPSSYGLSKALLVDVETGLKQL